MHPSLGAIKAIILAGGLAGILAGLAVVGSAYSEEIISPSPNAVPAAVEPEPIQPVDFLYSFKAEAPPKRLIIPALKINAPIQEVGLTPDGAMETVPDFFEVGWYKYGPHPGALGSAVVEGHFDTDNRAAPQAIFYHLRSLKPNDAVLVEDSSGRVMTFHVIQSIWYPYTFWAEEIFTPAEESRLNLITCGGRWLKDKRVYDQRLVVFTERVD